MDGCLKCYFFPFIFAKTVLSATEENKKKERKVILNVTRLLCNTFTNLRVVQVLHRHVIQYKEHIKTGATNSLFTTENRHTRRNSE